MKTVSTDSFSVSHFRSDSAVCGNNFQIFHFCAKSSQIKSPQISALPMDPSVPSPSSVGPPIVAVQQHHFPSSASSSSSSAVLLQQLLQLQQSLVPPMRQIVPRQISAQNATAFPSLSDAIAAMALQQQNNNNCNNLLSSSSSSAALLNNNLPSSALFVLQQQQQQQQQVLLLGRLFQCQWPSSPFVPSTGERQNAATGALLLGEEKRMMATTNSTKVVPLREEIKAEEHLEKRQRRRAENGGQMKTEEQRDTKPKIVSKCEQNALSPITASTITDQHGAATVVVGRHGFSIDGLLAIGGGTSAKVDYFMEEGELSWTDGRRSRKSHQKQQHFVNAVSKEIALPKAMPKKKHPPLPSSSCGGKHVCAECGKSYATSSNLSRHKQTHRSWEHAKKCPVCGKQYVSMPALSMHLLTHDAQHKCHLCGKRFSRPWLLKGHIRSHTGHKPFGCGNCGKAFSDKSNLRAHLNTHNNEKRWHCELCGRVFALRSYLSKHLEQHHNETMNNSRRKGEEEMGTVLPSYGLR